MSVEGPTGWQNWRAYAADRAWGTTEYPLFTDAWLTSEVPGGLGPYTILNAIRGNGVPDRYPAAYLRADWHLGPNADHVPAEKWKTETAAYHGGDFADELASLISLVLGIRLQAGGETRQFGSHVDDPLGRPISYWFKSVRPLSLPRYEGRAIMPRQSSHVDLGGLLTSPLISYATLDQKSASAVVQTARLYQEALWIAEDRPEWTWVMLVSAVERAAACWQDVEIDPAEWLDELEPTLRGEFEAANCSELFSVLASKLAKYIGSTKRFREFVLEFLPAPPPVRPAHGRYPWSEEALGRAMTTIYKWRSLYLHKGVPFPAPMCEPPTREEAKGACYEVPIGLGMRVAGGTWLAKDVPMMLHLFEYIVRHALLGWWTRLAPSPCDINRATAEELETIEGIGPSRAKAIVEYRTRVGGFGHHHALRQVPGIGEKLASDLAGHTALVPVSK